MSFKIFLLLLFILSASIHSQEKILYTYVDYKLGEVRAAILNTANKERTDLGFNKTYLPAWLGDKILFNGQNYIWRCNEDGNDLKKITDGFRVSVSADQNLFAFYSKNGISIYDSSLNLFKELDVDAWTDVSITWLKNDSAISYYNLDKQTCYLYFIYEDSVTQFGEYVYHPLQFGSQVIFNRMDETGLFSVYIHEVDKEIESARKISEADEMAVVPMWSHDGKEICYLRVKPDSAQNIQSDMFRSELIFYDLEKSTYKILSDDAAFTDQAFPQFTFSQDGEYIFYTAIVENGNGVIKIISLINFEVEQLTDDVWLDERFPICK